MSGGSYAELGMALRQLRCRDFVAIAAIPVRIDGDFGAVSIPAAALLSLGITNVASTRSQSRSAFLESPLNDELINRLHKSQVASILVGEEVVLLAITAGFVPVWDDRKTDIATAPFTA